MTLSTRCPVFTQRLLFMLIWIAASSLVLLAQKADLSDEDVAAALAAGAKGRGRQQGLQIRDSSGFNIEIFTPTTWIQQAASEAAAQSRQLPQPVPAELLAPVLRIIALPIMPHRESPAGVSVTTIVLRDTARQTVIQPSVVEPVVFNITHNDFGPPVTVTGLKAQFRLESLPRVQDAKGEFLITLESSERRERHIKIKQKQLARLK